MRQRTSRLGRGGVTGDPTSLEAFTALALNDEPERVFRDILSIRPFRMDTNRLGFDLV